MLTDSAFASSFHALPKARRTVVVVDLVASVSLMERDEVSAVGDWRRFVEAMVTEVLPATRGVLVKSLGDGLLLTFDHPSDAVQAAWAAHQHLSRVSAGSAHEMRLRCGVHTCDVFVDALDVYGSGVNLAARLASLAQPGNVVASLEVRDALAESAAYEHQDLGLCFLKHLEQPVRAFVVREPSAEARTTTVSTVGDERPASAVPVDSALPAPGEEVPFDLRPTVAVVPFDAWSPDGGATIADRAMGEALADDVIAPLSRVRTLRVLSRLSTGTFRRAQGDIVQALRQRLGADYAVTGGLRRAGPERYRVRAELVELRHGSVLWSDRFEIDAGDLFAGEDAAVPHITMAVAQAIAGHEAHRTQSLPFPNLAGFTLYAGAVTLLHRLSVDDFDRAQPMLEHLSERLPQSAPPHAMLAKWHIMRLVQGWSDDRRRDGLAARDQARRALERDPGDAFSLAIDGLAHSIVGLDPASAQQRFLAAVATNPNEAYAWALLSGTHSHLGEADHALCAAERALSLSPLDPARFLFEAYRALALLVQGRPDDAALAARTSVNLNAMHAPSHRLLVIALMLAGQESAARAAAEWHQRLVPSYRVSDYLRHYPGQAVSHATVHAKALQAAGIPV